MTRIYKEVEVPTVRNHKDIEILAGAIRVPMHSTKYIIL